MYNPFWALHAAQALNTDPEFSMWPPQYKWELIEGKLAEFKGVRDEVIGEKKVASHLSDLYKENRLFTKDMDKYKFYVLSLFRHDFFI